MIIDFRQGIADYDLTTFPFVVSGGGTTIQLVVGTRPITLTIAQTTNNYTFQETATVNAAWTVPTTQPSWLYWDFNTQNFTRTFGYTSTQPFAQPNQPVQGAVVSLGTVTGGSGYVNGTYTNVPLVDSTGSGTGALATVVVSGNAVTSVAVPSSTAGSSYAIGDSLTALNTNLGGAGSGFSIPVTGVTTVATGTMWYNTQTFQNYVYQNSNWTQVLRVFAALYNPLTSPSFQFTTMGDEPPQSSGAQNFTGTQIGVNQVNVASGFPLFNYNGVPIGQGDGTFLTTENVMFAQGAAITGVRLESNVYTAFSSDVTTIPAYAVVAVQESGTIQLGSYNDAGNTAIALAIQNISSGGSGAVCLEGTVTNTLWNWADYIGELLWISGNNPGQLVTIDPHLSSPITYPTKQPPVARVLSQDTIIFLQGIGTQGPAGPPGSGGGSSVPATPTQQGVVYLSTDGGQFTPVTNLVVAEGDPRLTNARTALASSTLAATNITVAPYSPANTYGANAQLALQALAGNTVNLAGSTMTGALILSGDPTATFQAATKHYVDTNFYSLESELLPLSGGTMTGPLILSGNPTQPLQAATKQYVDNIAEGITFQAAVVAASTSDVGATYAGNPNYTLTANTNGVFTIDGEQPAVGARVLIKNQTVGTQNGVYDVTQTGSVSTPFVLTRDAEQLPPNTIVSGTFVFVNTGVTQNSTGWILSTPNPITLDTTTLTFVQFSSAANVTSSAIITALGYTPVGPFPVTAGTAGISVSGSPVSGPSPSGPVLSLSTELVGLNGLSSSGFGFVQRTGVGTYIAQAITSSQVTTALGYIPLASANINTTAPLSGGGPLTSGGLTLSILPFTGSALGAVPVSPGGTTQFLRADGSWAIPPGSSSGGVSSVALGTNSPSAIVIGGTNPITSAGTITVNLQLANTGSISSLGTITGGSGYVSGTYTGVPLTGGSGAGALATIVVTSTAVSSVTITSTGSNYRTGDTLSVNNSNLGGSGSGFSVPVSVITANPGLTQDATGLYVGLSQITNQMLAHPSVAVSASSGSGTLYLGSSLSITADSTKGLSSTLTGGTIQTPPSINISAAFAGTTSSNVGVSWFDPVFFTTTSGKVSFVAGSGTTGQRLVSGGSGNAPTWTSGQLNDVIFATSGQTIVVLTNVTATSKFPTGTTAYVKVYVNGVLQREDNSTGNAYSISGSFYVSGTHQLTFFSGLSTNDEVTVYQL